jgi:hypothetical protein
MGARDGAYHISPLIISLEDVSESNDEDEIMEEVKV